ncbi:MAG: SMI1/KNR4 family protein [Pirellulales bacterium]
MTEGELHQVEEALGHRLPPEFREVMLNFPQALIDAATMTDPDGNEFMDCMLISPNVDALLAAIAHYQSSESGWPKQYIVVGENGCGEVYSIDTSKGDCPVFVSGPHNDAGAASPDEEGYFEQVAPGVEQWVRGLVRTADAKTKGVNPIE